MLYIETVLDYVSTTKVVTDFLTVAAFGLRAAENLKTRGVRSIFHHNGRRLALYVHPLKEEHYMYDMDQVKKLPALGKSAPAAWEAFQAFDKAALADGAIPKKYKELIALAVAMTTQCPYCLEIHKGAAIAAGATEEEIAETTFVAAALRAGAAVTHGLHLVSE